MSQNFRAYSGNDPYIFVSYSHKDSARVYPIIQKLHTEGYRIWYDEGIAPTEEWRGVINEHIRDCGIFLVFVTSHSIDSVEVVKECTYAINLHKPLHIIYLDNVPDSRINSNLLADFANNQRVHAYELHSSVFERRLREPLSKFRDADHEPRIQPAENKTSITVNVSEGISSAASIDSVALRIWREVVGSKKILSLAFTIFYLLLNAAIALSFAIVLIEFLIEADFYYVVVALIGVFPVFSAVLLFKSFYALNRTPKNSALHLSRIILNGNLLCCISVFFSLPLLYFGIIISPEMYSYDKLFILLITSLAALATIILVHFFSTRICDVLSSNNINFKRLSFISLFLKFSSTVFIIFAVLICIYFINENYCYFWGSISNAYLAMCVIAYLIALFIHHTYFRTIFRFGNRLVKEVNADNAN